MDFQESETMECELVIKLLSNTPVVGIEMNPFVRANFKNPSHPPKHFVQFNWYRMQLQSTCSVHHSELATVQCLSCVKLNVPVKESYHCSRKCFLDAWQDHLLLHRRAAQIMSMTSKAEEEAGQELKGFGSWPDLTALHKHEGVIHREGIEWMKVGSSQTYVPSVDDFGHRLRLESVVIDCASHSPLSPVNFTVIDPVITAPAPRPRCMIQIGHVKKYSDTIFSGQTSKAKNFSVLSYNILSDLYVSNDRYAYCPSWALSWEYRRQNLLREITGYGADILCLQEVQSDHFENFFKPELEKHGYSGVYKKKTNMVYTGSQYVIDGCAILFQKNRFKEVGSYEIQYDKLASSIVELLEPERRMEARNRLMKDNVAVIVVLETVIDRVPDAFLSRICVANTHIHSNVNLPDVKLFQVSNLVNVLESILVQSQIPLVICGDLNSLPRSEPYNLLVTRRVYSIKEDPYSIAPHLKLQHSISLGSAYSSLLDSRVIEDRYKKPMDTQAKEPFFTNFTPRFSGTLDYIFYTVDKLQVEGLLELLDSEDLGSGLPSPLWSSDHIALMARFSFKPPLGQEHYRLF